MHRAKAFFWVCGGVLMLAISFHLGSESARAGSNIGDTVKEAAAMAYNPVTKEIVVINKNGDMWVRIIGEKGMAHGLGNFWELR